MIRLEDTPEGCIVPVKAQPGARRNAIRGVYDGSLRVAVTASPDKGKANQAIAALLAETLGVAKSKVILVSGQAARQKRFLVEGMSIEEANRRLEITSESPD